MRKAFTKLRAQSATGKGEPYLIGPKTPLALWSLMTSETIWLNAATSAPAVTARASQ